MSDQELLELAAKAAGVKGVWHEWWDDLTDSTSCGIAPKGACGRDWWNPLTDDGDALRLLCKLKLSLNSNSLTVGVGGYTPGGDHVFAQEQIIDGDAQSAHRRAIVSAAAEIGRAMP